MVVELGPLPAADVLNWTKFGRRIAIELRAVPADNAVVSGDVIDLWSQTLTTWASAAQQAVADGAPFRWSSEMEPAVVEFLLHGLDTCLHSKVVAAWVTETEAMEHRPVTIAIIRALVDELSIESTSCQHYVDQLLTSLAPLLTES